MIPRFQNLVPYRKKTLSIDRTVLDVDRLLQNNRVETTASSSGVILADVGGNLRISSGAGGAPDLGVWAKYAGGKATYGIAAGGENWGATGPFSGCRIEAGYMSDGRKYLAHIAVDAIGSSRRSWLEGHDIGGMFAGANILLRGKVSPVSANSNRAFVFVVWEGGGLQAVKMDVAMEAAGAGFQNFTINTVQRIINPVKPVAP